MNYPNIKKYFEDNKVKIGSGAFGDVLKVIPKGDPSRPIAVKVINLQNLFDSTLPADKLEETLKNEIEILESLSKEVFKPKCFPVYYNYVREVSKSKEITYSIFFQYYPLSLSALIANKKEKKDTFETKTIYKYCVSLLNCLAFLQLMGICHRDLKPNNILLDDSLQNLILIDFGISENVAPKLQNFNTTRIQMQLEGTKSYFSPEMLEGFDNSDEDHIKINPFKADVFSFGIIFLEMILLQKLKNNPQKLKTDKQRLLRKLEDMRNQVEDKMEMDKLIGILNSCLEINPKDRPDFVTLFINSLKFIPGKALKFHILIEEARKEDVSKLFDKGNYSYMIVIKVLFF